ncbi:MAG TPA: cyclopropane-fatty-acyl-phospholipid synthase family protein [Paracoccaceae bacterium]|nr:cyclopropane-fatty-acyl-phospholipid synthase family protein [Paracoccaceae bacterium]
MRFLPIIFRKAVKSGTLELRGPGGYVGRFGGDAPGPEVALRVMDPSLDWKIALHPELRAAEAIMDGGLVVEEGSIHDFVTLFISNRPRFNRTPSQAFWRAASRRSRRFLQHNPVTRARRNAAHHYDLGNEFYRLWLDSDMQYSCGYWADGVETLEQAQTAKKRHIAAKLGLEPGMRVLDIGCGWGGMAIYLAAICDVHVTGITLAGRQLDVARKRADILGLSDRLDFRLQDYREVGETFDRVVSVGMLEHVGAPYLPAYFRKVHDCLAPDGVALIHAISARHPPAVTSAFLRKYIFPGGYSPVLSETTAAIEKSGLWSLDIELWRVHYAKTLAEWRKRFMAVRGQVVDMYDDRFARMWEIYLSGSELSFTHGSSMVAQYQLGRTRDAMPLTRAYLGPAEERLRAREVEIGEIACSASRALGG